MNKKLFFFSLYFVLFFNVYSAEIASVMSDEKTEKEDKIYKPLCFEINKSWKEIILDEDCNRFGGYYGGYLFPKEILQELYPDVKEDLFLDIIKMLDCFFLAAKKSNLKVLNFFCKLGFWNPDNTYYKNDKTPLLQAMFDNNEATCGYLLRSDKDNKMLRGSFKFQDSEGRSCIMLINGSREYKDEGNSFVLYMIQKVINLGLRVDFKDHSGKTALMYHAGNLKVVDLLLSNGADIELKDNEGKTFFDYFNNAVSSLPYCEYLQKVTEFNQVLEKHKINIYLV